MSDLIDRAAMEQAMQTKLDQLSTYHASLAGREDEVGRHARTVAFGRLLQVEADMVLLSLQPTT